MNMPTRTPRQSLCSPRHALLLAGFLTLALAGEATAATYNFWLKSSPGTPYAIGGLKCATGSFDFTKNGTTGSFPASGTNMSILANCIGTGSPAANRNLSGTLTVVVRNITLNAQNQGPNVDGVTGTLASRTFIKSCSSPTVPAGTQSARWDVTFFSSPGSGGAPGARTFNLVENVGACTTGTPNLTNPIPTTLVSNGPYHLHNTANPIPEPGALLLTLGGLGALVFARRLRKRA